MNIQEKIAVKISCLKWDIIYFFRKKRKQIWNKRILLWWYKLYIRKNKFHPSLDIDIYALDVMNETEKEKYYADQHRRRVIAYQRDLENQLK